MAEEGLLKLDAAICDYLPGYPADTGKKITIRHLLSNTSGIPHHVDARPDYWVSHDKIFHTPKELWELFADGPLAHEPGKQFTYSSPGFYILGAVLQQAAGRSYAELLQEDIFGPLGMKDSRVENNRTVENGMATGYMRGLAGLVRAGFEDKSTALAAGDIVTNARDLHLWDQGLRTEPGRPLSAESKRLLYASIFPDHMMSIGGPLLRIPYDEGRKTLSVNRLSGSSTGYAAAMDRFFELDGCVIVLSNVQDAPIDLIVDHVWDFLLRHELDTPVGVPAPETMTPPPPAAVPEKDVRKFLGFYRDADGMISGVVRDEGKLYYLSCSGESILPPVEELVPKSAEIVQFGNRASREAGMTDDPKDGRRMLVFFRNGRAIAELKSIDAQDGDDSEYTGSFTSVEIQKTYRFSLGPDGLVAENFLGESDLRMAPLEKDLFGYEHGFVKFIRDADGAIKGFKLMTKDVDTFLGSKFIKIFPD